MAYSTSTRVLLALGYSLVNINNGHIRLPDNLTADDFTYFSGILTQLDAIDTELENNTRDSMAVQVQDLTLDYNRYIAQTLARANRLLQQLSRAASTPVAFNKYGGGNHGIKLVRSYY